MLKFIYSKKDEGIYRVRRVFGIRIITKPIELRILCKLQDIENKINNIENNITNKEVNTQLFKLESYKIYSGITKKAIL